GVRMQVNAGKTESRGKHRRAGLAIGPESLSILIQLGVVLAGAPTVEHFFDGGAVDAEELLVEREIRRECHDRPDVEIAVRPAVETIAGPFHARVVHRGVADRAGDSDRDELVAIALRRGAG